MINVFITGITGLLGTNLTKDLLDKGFCVKALIHRTFPTISHPNLILIQGNLYDDIISHLSDIEVFIHIAAQTGQNLTTYTEYKKVNVDATIHLFIQCQKSGVKKFIFVSSANTIGYGSKTDLGNENNPMRAPFTKSKYAQSKYEAEQYLIAHNKNIELNIINPTFMIGGNDSKPSSGKIILMGWKKKLILYPPGGKNFVSVKDVSQAIIQCMKAGQNKERYLICNENLSYKEFFNRLKHLTNQKTLMIKIPKFILMPVGYFGDILNWLNIKTSINSTNMKALCIHNYYTNEKSIKELQLNYEPIDNAILEAIIYFENNFIKK